MKKLLSIILSFVILISAFSVTGYATETSLEKKQLSLLLTVHDSYFSSWGRVGIYQETSTADTYATNVYYDETSTDADYALACDVLLNSTLNFNIYPEYAEYTYEKALQEQNYNNWYSDEEWADYQEKLQALGDAIDAQDGTNRTKSNLTKAFHALLKSYNEMTHSYQNIGDLNKDGEINIADVTLLQKYLAGMEDFTGAQKMLVGCQYYEAPDIADATVIQKYVAGLMTEIPDNRVFAVDYEHWDKDLIMERTLNFNICPRRLSEVFGFGSIIPNQYVGIGFLDYYYYWCYENNCEP